jgi:hypothetical protein
MFTIIVYKELLEKDRKYVAYFEASLQTNIMAS